MKSEANNSIAVPRNIRRSVRNSFNKPTAYNNYSIDNFHPSKLALLCAPKSWMRLCHSYLSYQVVLVIRSRLILLILSVCTFLILLSILYSIRRPLEIREKMIQISDFFMPVLSLSFTDLFIFHYFQFQLHLF